MFSKTPRALPLVLGILIFSTEVLAAAPEVLVNFTILRDRRNQGNTAYVDRAYLDRVAQRATERSLGTVIYKINRVDILSDDKIYFERDEFKTLKKLEYKSQRGYVNAIYSNDDTNNTGRALITGSCCSSNNPSGSNKYRYNPTIIFHSRIRDTSAKSVDNAAALLLHELGHQIGYHHVKNGVNADNFYKTSSAIPIHVRWARTMQSYRPAPPKPIVPAPKPVPKPVAQPVVKPAPVVVNKADALVRPSPAVYRSTGLQVF